MKQKPVHYNQGGLYAFLGSVVFSLFCIAYTMFLSPSISLGETEAQPGTDSSGPDVSQITEYWLTNEDMIAHGKKIFMRHCASCHGHSGAGDGVASRGLVPPPRNLIEGQWKIGGDSITLFKTLVEGIKDTSMVPYAHLPRLDRWGLVHYIRSITQNKTPDPDPEELKTFAEGAK